MLTKLMPFPTNSVVHQLSSPGFHVDPPEVIGGDLIPANLKDALSVSWNSTQPNRMIEFHSLKDVFVVGEGLVFDRDFCLLAPSLTQTPALTVDAAVLELRAAVEGNRVTQHSGTVLLCGKAGLNNYGHWLAEMLPLAHFSHEWISRENGWRVLVPKVYPWMKSVIADSLDLLDATDTRRILGTGEPCHVDELVFVTGLTKHGEFFSPRVIEAMDVVASRIDAGSDDRLWISRENETRSLADERLVTAALSLEGWRIVNPGQISFREQVALAKGARHMAGVNGAGLSNLLFMAPGGTFTTFVPAIMPDIFYWQLAAHRGLTYREIRSEQNHGMSGPTTWDAPLTIETAKVLSHLRAI